eukprot:CAMPEP_0181056380 /NCGR_PEP_ID=MMETSP1070-20121207/19696_1 /TAXON_ID=265543 /ORGANISM="Minutocellus polymorphus, Strain NH13" /LENGTH=465 /DNA_ID=CAMNT_0023135743 /DNA_START=67 /DNA_END=1463 /DNA_ORIENTATION=-
MPRSEEAIRRRAEKRLKSVAEQRQADFADAKRCKERQAAREAKDRGAPTSTPDAAPAAADTTPPAPKTSLRDGHAAGKPPNRRTVTPPRQNTKKGVKYQIKRNAGSKGKERTKPAKWAKQADQAQIERNAALRKQYSETKGEGMTEEDIQRAKVLILRNERKRAKKAEWAKRKLESAAPRKNETSTKEMKSRNTKKEKPESAALLNSGRADTNTKKKEQPSVPSHHRPKKPTPIDLAWRQVAIDEKEGRIPEFKAETEAEKKLERIAERNRKCRAELAKIRTLLAGDSKDIDAGLEAVGRYATNGSSSSDSASSDDENIDIQGRKGDVVGIMKKILKKRGKRVHKKPMRYKKLTRKVQRRLKISKHKHADLKQLLKQIGEVMDEFKVDGKIISLKVGSLMAKHIYLRTSQQFWRRNRPSSPPDRAPNNHSSNLYRSDDSQDSTQNPARQHCCTLAATNVALAPLD